MAYDRLKQVSLRRLSYEDGLKRSLPMKFMPIELRRWFKVKRFLPIEPVDVL